MGTRLLPRRSATHRLSASDAIHSVLVERADALEGCLEGSEEEVELTVITDAIEAYEVKR
jgi:hypothetical protein